MKISTPIVLSVLLIVIGLVNILLWRNDILSIRGLVFGGVLLILAWFVFHFRHKK